MPVSRRRLNCELCDARRCGDKTGGPDCGTSLSGTQPCASRSRVLRTIRQTRFVPERQLSTVVKVQRTCSHDSLPYGPRNEAGPSLRRGPSIQTARRSSQTPPGPALASLLPVPPAKLPVPPAKPQGRQCQPHAAPAAPLCRCTLRVAHGSERCPDLNPGQEATPSTVHTALTFRKIVHHLPRRKTQRALDGCACCDRSGVSESAPVRVGGVCAGTPACLHSWLRCCARPRRLRRRRSLRRLGRCATRSVGQRCVEECGQRVHHLFPEAL